MSDRKYSFICRTIQATCVKKLVETCKDIIGDVNFYIDGSGISICQLDNSQSIIIQMSLLADEFETYMCEAPFIAGINLSLLHKFLKCIGHKDTLEIYMLDEDRDRLGIRVENLERNMNVSMRLMDIDREKVSIKKNQEFDVEIELNASDFQKACKDLSIISDEVTIEENDGNFSLACYGICADAIIKFHKNSNDCVISYESEKREVIRQMFSLKFINMIAKISDMSPNVKIYLKKTFPLAMIFQCGTLGDIKFILAPKNVEEEEEE